MYRKYTLKKFLYFLIFQEIELSGSNVEKVFYIFSKGSFPCISGNRNIERSSYVLGNGTFLYLTILTWKNLCFTEKIP